MKKNALLLIILILVNIVFFSGCTNNNNGLSQSKVTITINNLFEINSTDVRFKDILPYIEGYSFFYADLRVKNDWNEEILTNPFYFTIEDNEGTSWMHSSKTYKFPLNYTKDYIQPGYSRQGILIFQLYDHSIPVKLIYFDPLNNINITTPLQNIKRQ